MNKNMPPYFLGKRILITGASSGLGRSLAFWYLNNGAQVALVGRDIEALSKIGEQFRTQAFVIQCDLSIDLQQYDMALSVIEKLGGLDILINCAGLIFDGDIESTFPQDYDYLMDINLRCAFHLSILFYPHLQESRGCIVNVSSSYGSRPNAGTIGYCMTKAGLEMLTKCTALELAPLGIRVNAVSPNVIDTNLYRYTGMSEIEYNSFKKRAASCTPLQRISTVEEVARSIIFLTSEQSCKTTGHVMKVDGGKSLTSSEYQVWYGQEIMNRRFQPDFFSKLNYWLSSKKESKAKKGSDQWIKESQTSNWATHSEDAHFKVTQEYKNEKMNEDELNHYKKMHQEGGTMNPKKATKMIPGQKGPI